MPHNILNALAQRGGPATPRLGKAAASLAALSAAVLSGCSFNGPPYVLNDEARIRAVCEPESRVADTDAQGYKGGNDTLYVACKDGRFAILYEGQHQPKIVKGR